MLSERIFLLLYVAKSLPESLARSCNVVLLLVFVDHKRIINILKVLDLRHDFIHIDPKAMLLLTLANLLQLEDHSHESLNLEGSLLELIKSQWSLFPIRKILSYI